MHNIGYHPKSDVAGDEAIGRLPEMLAPFHYDLEIEPDLEKLTFKGSVIIHVEILKETNAIVFHSAVEIIASHVTHGTDTIGSSAISVDEDAETATIKLDKNFKPGSVLRLHLKFNGKMAPAGSPMGFYPGFYRDKEGNQRAMVATWFVPSMARRAFPSFDEPAMKATFSITLIADDGLVCLSNMEVSSETNLDLGKRKVHFKTTPRMSTYLIEMIVGPLNMIQSDKFRIPIRAWALPDRDIEGAKKVMDITAKALEIFERKFKISFPLSKMDLVGVRGQAGAMEHWGIVTFDERHLLDSSTANEEQLNTFVVAHELAHQWFGNLVTPAWWDGIWLKESFSSYMANRTIDEIFPEWRIWSDWTADNPLGGTGNYQGALLLDGSEGSHAVEDPTLSPNMGFDQIPYLKGTTLLRMISAILGEDAFLEGIRVYLRSHAYGNATTKDLWHALSSVSNQDVESIMQQWTKQVGYPLLTVYELEESGKILVVQSRFLQSGPIKAGGYDPIWPVSMTADTNEGTTELGLLSTRSGRFTISLDSYKLNGDQIGLYRVAYPLSRIHKFSKQWTADFMNPNNRVGILSDLAAVVASVVSDRRVRTSDYLEFISQIHSSEDDGFVWRQILSDLRRLETSWVFEEEAVVNGLDKFKQSILARFIGDDVDQIDPEAPLNEQNFRQMVFQFGSGSTLVQKKSKKIFSDFISGNQKTISNNIKRAVFETVMMTNNDKETYDKLSAIALDQKYVEPSDIVSPQQAQLALGRASEPSLVARTIAIITPTREDPGSVTVQNRVLSSLSYHSTGALAKWDWLRTNWDILMDPKAHAGPQGLDFIQQSISSLATWDHLDEVEAFFTPDKRSEATKFVLAQGLDNIRMKARWIEADRTDVKEWLSNKGFL